MDTKKLKPRMSPGPNRPFVNRQSELNLIHKKVSSGLRGDPIPLAITCFWGPFGMGKSWLLRELERQYRFGGLRSSRDRQTLAARLDLNIEQFPSLWQNDELKRENLIRELWKQLAGQINAEIPDLNEVSPEQWANEFIAKVTSWSSDYTILIMLDTVDDLIRKNTDSFFWLEQNLVERLVLTGKVLLIFTSRGELRSWKRFQVRQRVDSYRLTAFDKEIAGKEINASSSVTHLIYTHAFGHPLVTEYLGSALENENKGKSNKSAADIKLSSVREVLSSVVAEIFTPLQEPVASVAKYISVLRWVSVEILRFLIEKWDPNQKGHGDVYFLDQITKLQLHHILYWNNVQKNYEFDSVLRHLMTHCLEIDDPDLFRLANLNAFSFHMDHLERYPQYLARYAPELAYHRALLERCSSTADSLITFEAWWGGFLETQANHLSIEAWKELLAKLEQDEELRNLAPAEYESLISVSEAKVTAKAG